MRVTLSTILDTSAERAWAEVQTPRLLDHVAWPLLTFRYTEPVGRVWPEGVHQALLRGFGVLPMGMQRIDISKPMPGPNRYQLRDNGSGDLISRWDHLITIEPLSANRCRYTEEVEVSAGILTPFIWLFALLFYAHRQRRWRALVRSNFSY